ncbi:hypothetical protein PPSIR1_06241 [Plesiocystis pacifica SIR-1]|uniref:Lipoprotein n=1 Tax=Plesiocystis pacifica SIR-1 TaxID=391625 RepID=A6G6X3_9BACT|nr:hypothetical protein [Plesiocystis pacifica]EDM78426.1 hypothetical protein PPSIR1_06241 [Plesiocystis pacifica SIR-1]
MTRGLLSTLPCLVLLCAFAGCGDDGERSSETTFGADEQGEDADSSETQSDSSGTDSGSAEAETEAETDETSTDDASTDDESADAMDEEGPKFDFATPDAAAFEPIAVTDLPGLESITFYERSGGQAPTAYTFTVDGPELTTKLDDPLGGANFDIMGVSTEFYDVYYSDVDGEFMLDGSYLTISGVFGQAMPAGGGLNLAEIGLNFDNEDTEFGNYVASFVTLGDNAVPENVENAIDGDLQTHTTMGNTVGANPGQRLRVTLGFESTSGPQG